MRMAKLLKQARANAQLSQVNLGKEIGVVSQYISNIERGYCSLSPQYFKITSEQLNIPVASFIKAHIEDERKRIIEIVEQS